MAEVSGEQYSAYPDQDHSLLFGASSSTGSTFAFDFPSKIIEGLAHISPVTQSNPLPLSAAQAMSDTWASSAPALSGLPARPAVSPPYIHASSTRADRESTFPSYSFPSLSFKPTNPLSPSYTSQPQGYPLAAFAQCQPMNHSGPPLSYAGGSRSTMPFYHQPVMQLHRQVDSHGPRQELGTLQLQLNHQQQQWLREKERLDYVRCPPRLDSMPPEILFQILSHLLRDLKWAAVLNIGGTSRRLKLVFEDWKKAQVAKDSRYFQAQKDIYIMEMERDCSRFYPVGANRAGIPVARPSKGRRSESGMDTTQQDQPRQKWKKPKMVGGLGCYVCHSIKPPEYFERSPLMPAIDEEKMIAKKTKGKKGKGKMGHSTGTSSPASALSEEFQGSSPLSFHSSPGLSPLAAHPPVATAAQQQIEQRRHSNSSPELPVAIKEDDSRRSLRRFCIDCGIKTLKRYRAGDLVYNRNGVKVFVCDCPKACYNETGACNDCKKGMQFRQRESEY